MERPSSILVTQQEQGPVINRYEKIHIPAIEQPLASSIPCRGMYCKWHKPQTAYRCFSEDIRLAMALRRGGAAVMAAFVTRLAINAIS
jgi:hypothetical protein